MCRSRQELEKPWVRSQARPVTQVDGEGKGRGGLWGAVPLCSSCLCGFAARCLVVDPGLPLVNRVSSTDSRDAEWRRVRMCWNLPASLHLLSPLLIMMTFIQGVVVALSLLLPNLMWAPPWASFNSEPCREEPSRKWSSSLSKLTHYKLPRYLTERTETFYRKIISLLCLITP